MSFKVSKVFKNPSEQNKFINLCQDIMVGHNDIQQKTFCNRVLKFIPSCDPISKHISSVNVNKLYVFLKTMSTHPMCVILSRSLIGTFLEMIKLPTQHDIVQLLKKYNAEYNLNTTESQIIDVVNAQRCTYEELWDRILKCSKWPLSRGYVKVILVYRAAGTSRSDFSSGVQVSLRVPFPTLRKTMYVDITGKSDREIGLDTSTTRVFTAVDGNHKIINIPNDEVYGVNTSIGRALVDYYKMWRVTEAIFARAYSSYTQHMIPLKFVPVYEQGGEDLEIIEYD